MSRIFDVVSKHDIIDFSEMAQVETSDLAEPPPSPKQAVRVIRPVSSSQSANRVVRLSTPALSPIFPFGGEHQGAAEQYRMIRTKIWHGETTPRIVVVSSASSGDGKTITAINVAASLALNKESHVLLVDGDLHRPRVAEALGIPVGPGLSEVLSGVADLESALICAEQFPNLFILPAGNAGESGAELLESQRWHALVAQLRPRFSHVIVDAPPIAIVADYELLQLVCDGVVLVARPDNSDRSSLFKALENVPREKLLGVVMNCVEEWWLWKTPTYGYYDKPLPNQQPLNRHMP